MRRHDVIVIGAGHAGCAAALEGVRRGLDVLLVDSGAVGGGASRGGPIPARVLRETILQLTTARRLTRREQGAPRLRTTSMRSLLRLARDAIERHAGDQQRLLVMSDVRLVHGTARLISPTQIRIDERETHEAPAIVIATGSRARRPRAFPFHESVIRDGDTVFADETPPRSVVVLGANASGCEYACMFAALGANVTLIDRRSRLLRYVDRDLLSVLHARMQQMGIDVVLEEEVRRIEVRGRGRDCHAVLRLASGRAEHCDRLLVLAGREPRVEALDLDRAGVETDPRRAIHVDDTFCTSRPGVYAAGNVLGGEVGAGVSVHQGRAALLHALGESPPLEQEVPAAIYTIPEMAMVGLSEEACQRLGIPCDVGVARYRSLLRGRICGDPDGMLKLVFHGEEGRLLGAHLIGSSASELIHLGTAWLDAGRTAEQIAGTVLNHPTLSEAYRVAALDALARRPQQGWTAMPERAVG